MKKLVVIVLFLLPAGLNSQSVPDSDSLKIIQKKLIRYLENSQQNNSAAGYYYSGEWQSVISMRKTYLLLSKPPDTYDSNCFSTSAIHNSLAATFLIDPSTGKDIPAMLEKSMVRILNYYD